MRKRKRDGKEGEKQINVPEGGDRLQIKKREKIN